MILWCVSLLVFLLGFHFASEGLPDEHRAIVGPCCNVLTIGAAVGRNIAVIKQWTFFKL